MNYLNIAAIVDQTHAEGPGLRTAIWVQGCLKRCKECCNPDFLEIKPAHIMSIDEVCLLIESNHKNYGIEGITLLGGEPFLQAKGLADIAKYTQGLGLSVMIFSGYRLEELDESGFAGAEKLLNYTDLLADGEFEPDKQETERNWVGSSNQNFHYISDRYNPKIEKATNHITNEWRISSDNKLSGNGLPFIIKI